MPLDTMTNTRDHDLWHEYARAARALAAVRWSRGLRVAMLGAASEPERTDEELAAENVGGSLLAAIQMSAWSRIRTGGLEHAVLVAAADGGMDAVHALIGEAPARPRTSPPNLQTHQGAAMSQGTSPLISQCQVLWRVPQMYQDPADSLGLSGEDRIPRLERPPEQLKDRQIRWAGIAVFIDQARR